MDTIPQDTPQKQCYHCKQLKPYTSFGIDKQRHDGLKGICKECKNAKERAAYTPKVRPTLPEGMKRCSVCKELKPATLEYFNTNKTQSSGLRSSCKPCSKAQEARNCYLNGGNVKQEKRCPDCKETKSIEEFSLSKTRYDGRQSLCKECASVRHRQKHPLPATPDPTRKQCSMCKQWKPATLEYFHRHKGGLFDLLGYCRSCRTLHRVQFRTQERENDRWRRLHNPEAERVHENKRRARKRSVSGACTAEQIQDLLRRQKHKCYYAACGHAKFKKVNGKYIYHIEHTFPLSRVSSDIPANDISYIVLACPTCNLRKRNKFPHEWPEGGRLL